MFLLVTAYIFLVVVVVGVVGLGLGQFYWKKKRTKRYPQNGANAPMVGANVPTEPQNL